MEARFISKDTIARFYEHLQLQEKSENTVVKYVRDVNAFCSFAGNSETKELVINYKQNLIKNNYAVRSINSMLASINSLFDYLGWLDCKVKSLKLQREIYRSEEKDQNSTEQYGKYGF